MCIVIDMNTIHLIFSNNENDFTPVKNWIFCGSGKMVYGGTTYLNELGKIKKYNKIIKLLRDLNKVVVVDQSGVDNNETSLRENGISCNDLHLIAILIISKCRLIASLDTEAYPYFTDKSFYKKKSIAPKIYSKKAHRGLLRDNNIAQCCRPCVKLNKKERGRLEVK